MKVASAGAIAVALLATACSQTQQNAAATPAIATTTQLAQAPAGPPVLTAADLNFIEQAAQGGWSEVALGQMAEQVGGTAAVRALGARMASDHTQANQALTGVAASFGVTPPTAPDPGRQAVARYLQFLAGPAFDAQYLPEQLADHAVTITLFQQEAASSPTPALRSYAQQYLPMLRQHEAMLRSLLSTPVASAQ